MPAGICRPASALRERHDMSKNELRNSGERQGRDFANARVLSVRPKNLLTYYTFLHFSKYFTSFPLIFHFFHVTMYPKQSDYLAIRRESLCSNEKGGFSNEHHKLSASRRRFPGPGFDPGAGKAACILETLSDYGSIPLGVQERILKQTSFFQLDRWFLLARQVRSVEEFTNRM